jgi:hypothetical protein
MIHPSELILSLIEVYEIGNRVSMRIERVLDWMGGVRIFAGT